MIRPYSPALTLLLSLWLCPCRADDPDFVVFSVQGNVRADGRSLSTGMLLDAKSNLVVSSTSEATLFGRVGKVVVEAGFKGTLTQAEQDAFMASTTPGITPSIWRLLLSVLTFNSERGPPSTMSNNGWAFALDTPGNKCVLRGTVPLIAVEPAFEGRSASILDVASGNVANLTLNSPTTEWPSSLLVDPRAEYRATVTGLDKVVSIHLVEIEGGLDLTDTTLRQLAVANCVNQLLEFAAQVKPAMVLNK
jgi:hypothetical protein